MRGKKGFNRTSKAARQLPPLGTLLQQPLFARVRGAAEFAEHRRDIRCGQDREIGAALRTIEQHDLARELRDDVAGEHNRQVAGLTLGEIDQSVSSFARPPS
jgi:hypothetical protein